MKSKVEKSAWLTLGLLGVCAGAGAFIAPVSELVNEAFSGRRPAEAVELVFRHRVLAANGGTVEVIEKFIGNRGGALIQWQLGGQDPVYSDWTGKEYVFRSGKTLPSRTAAFLDTFVASSGTEFQDRMLREGFLRRDQLLQYRPGFSPSGDPKTWDTRSNYLMHQDVFIAKVGSEFAVAVAGTDEGNQSRVFYLSRNGKGVQRLEWGVGTEKAYWDFSNFGPYGTLGRLPRTQVLQINGAERVRSVLASARAIKRDALATARAASRQPSASGGLSAELEEAIRLIVRYR